MESKVIQNSFFGLKIKNSVVCGMVLYINLSKEYATLNNRVNNLDQL